MVRAKAKLKLETDAEDQAEAGKIEDKVPLPL
jgi:hypothetical protein